MRKWERQGLTRRGVKTEEVGVTRDGEVVHFVVHNDPSLGVDDEGSEETVDGMGERNCHAVLVNDRAMALNTAV